MKLLLFICFSFLSFVFADTNTSIAKQLPQPSAKDMQIADLKKRIQALENELAGYKQVKPIGTKALVSKQAEVLPLESEKKKFLFPAKAPETLPVYYAAKPQSVSDMVWNLELNGFTVLAKDEVLKDKTVISFTSETLKKTNSFMSVLHLLVNEGKEVRVQNPSYFAAAYLQEAYHYGDFNATLQALNHALEGMYEVEEKYKLADLASYHFMIGMPRVNDVIVVAKGENLAEKLNDVNRSKKIAYALELPDGHLLVGHKLSQGTYAYLEKIKEDKNAQLFPYQVMVSKKGAVMLAPKYYMALSLPLLPMTDFLKIASAPEVIINEIKEVYK